MTTAPVLPHHGDPGVIDQPASGFQSIGTEPGNVALLDVVKCAEDDLDAYFLFMNEQNAPLNRFIGVINFFLELIGIDERIPCLVGFTRLTIDPVLDFLDALIEFLWMLLGLIQIPLLSEPNTVDCE